MKLGELAESIGQMLLAGLSEETVITGLNLETGEIYIEATEIPDGLQDHKNAGPIHEMPRRNKWQRDHRPEPGCWCNPKQGSDGIWRHNREAGYVPAEKVKH